MNRDEKFFYDHAGYCNPKTDGSALATDADTFAHYAAAAPALIVALRDIAVKVIDAAEGR